MPEWLDVSHSSCSFSLQSNVMLAQLCSEQDQGADLSEETGKYKRGDWGLWNLWVTKARIAAGRKK